MDANSTIVNIYGPIPDQSEIILGVGNYNNVHGLLTYSSGDDLLQMTPLTDVLTPSVLPLTIVYEPTKNNRPCFSLAVNGTNNYVNVKLENQESCACISSDKALFWLDYSSVDAIPRAQILAGGLYSLQTTVGDKDYVVSWKIKGFTNGDLVIFLPTTWYERNNDTCVLNTGSFNLVENLYKLSFKGYSDKRWCEESSNVVHCSAEQLCGDCFGTCSNPGHICLPEEGKFVCSGNHTSMVTFTENNGNSTNMIAIWIALIAIVLVVALLTWGKFNSE